MPTKEVPPARSGGQQREAHSLLSPAPTTARLPHKDAPPGTDRAEGRPRWYAARIAARADFAVRDRLRAQGIEEFCPLTERESRWTDRLQITTLPLFAGYLFVRLADNAARIAVLQTHGVVGILSADGRAAAIPDREMENLRRVCEAPRSVACCPYVAGAAVTVARGPFAGITGIVVRTKGAVSLVIPVTILGRAVNVEIDLRDLDAPKPAAKPKGTL